MNVTLRKAGGALLAAAALAALPAPAQAANHVPECHGMTTAVAPGGDRAFQLRCADHDGPLFVRVQVVDGPDHGTLTLLGGTGVRYKPAAGYSGDDSFTYRASDTESETATVTQQLRVTNANLAPQCLALEVTAVNGFADIQEPCYDPNEGDAVQLIVADDPEHGSVDRNSHGTSVHYSAGLSYKGSDAFSLQASDGALTSAATEIQLDAVPLEPPTCESRPVLPVRTSTTKTIRLLCRDNSETPNSIGITYTVVDEPEHGQADHNFFDLLYTPADGYEGPDQLTLRPQSSAGMGPPVTIDISVADDAN